MVSQKETKSFPFHLLLQIELVLLVFLLPAFVIMVSPHTMQTKSEVMGAATAKSNIQEEPKEQATPAIVPTATQAPEPTEEPTPTPHKTKKPSYTVAAIGDSMVDTMGERMEYLEKALKKKYPQTKFTFYNYGIGSQNIEEGLARFSKTFDNKDRHFQSLPDLKPDILIVGSFAYNPFTPHDRNKHWLDLASMIEQAKGISSQVYALAEIAPLRKDFGKGPHGVNWDDGTNIEHSKAIIEQLENVFGLAKNEHVPVIDAYHLSMKSSGVVDKKYVNTDDGIHPSVEGHELTAEAIADALALEK